MLLLCRVCAVGACPADLVDSRTDGAAEIHHRRDQLDD
jgi:hypothetical protein